MKPITNINQLDLNASYTYNDYLNWRFKERLELIKGKILKMSPAPNRHHQKISIQLSSLMWFSMKEQGCNVYSAPFDVRLLKKNAKKGEIITVVQPDICIVCDEEKLDDRGCIGAPDLIVEILSPGNSNKEMSIKFDLYQENGVKEYWIVNPMEKNVLIYTLQKGVYIGMRPFVETDTIKSPLFPQLKCKLKEVFI